MSPQSSIGVLKTISEPMVRLSHLGHLSCTKINTISKQNERSFHLTHITWVRLQADQRELSLDPHHLQVPSGVTKTIFKPIACSVQTMHQSCVEINTISKWTKMNFHLTDPPHRGGPLGEAKKIPCPWYIRRKPCSYLAPSLTSSPSGPSEHPLDPRHLGVPLGAPKMISKPIARSAQPCTYLAY
jgi:hypothetical protein